MRISALLVLALSCAPALLFSQVQSPNGAVIATVRSESGASLADAEVRSETRQALTDAEGIARLTLATGRHRLTVARIGFDPATIEVDVTADREVRVTVTLEPLPYRLDSVTVLSTRIGSNPEDSPLKVDVIAPEDV
ncbi:MAG TPA: carboxypeptidase-like regulatory domain-containing protein, partial [Gemmatimonadales bacterium]